MDLERSCPVLLSFLSEQINIVRSAIDPDNKSNDVVASLERGRRARSTSSDSGRTRQSSADHDRRTVRSSLLDVPAQRAPDFRTEKSKNIQELISFLQEWGIECPERFTLKEMQCPSTKIFVEVFKFIAAIIIPNTVLSGKPEDQIPFILKSVGYPYAITRSSVVSIAPHSWPALCHALVWFTRCITDMRDVIPPDNEFVKFSIDLAINPRQKATFEEDMRTSMLGEHKSRLVHLKEQIDKQSKIHEELVSQIGNPGDWDISVLEANQTKMEVFLLDTNKYIQSKQEAIIEQASTNQNLAALFNEKSARRHNFESEYQERVEELDDDARQQIKTIYASLLEQCRQLGTELEEKTRLQCDNEMKLALGRKELEALQRKIADLPNQTDIQLDPSTVNAESIQRMNAENSALDKAIKMLRTEEEGMRKQNKQLQEKVLSASIDLNNLKLYHEQDEQKRLTKISAAYEQYESTAKIVSETLDKQVGELEHMNVQLECLKAEYESAAVILDVIVNWAD